MKKTKTTTKVFKKLDGVYNPSDVGVKNGNFFGLQGGWESRPVVCIPVPWELTVSFGRGTARAPAQIMDVSTQLDLCRFDVDGVWRFAPGMGPDIPGLQRLGRRYARAVKKYLWLLEHGWKLLPQGRFNIGELNQICRWMCDRVFDRAISILDLGKIPAVVGGDHSTALGLIEALALRDPGFGILVVDSHLDLRMCYEGFDYSHASVFWNASRLDGVESITYVGSRDFCEDEVAFCRQGGKPISIYTDQELFEREARGETWNAVVDDMLFSLPKRVYVSFDIDGLEQQYCPKTGTPVPGGLSWNKAVDLIRAVERSGRRIVGFDVTETGGGLNLWDASVAARLIFELGVAAARSNAAVDINVGLNGVENE